LQSSFTVDLYEPADLEKVLAIESASFGRDAWPKAAFLDYFHQCPDLFLVARRGRKLAGYTITSASSRNAELVSIAVDPKERRKGIAWKLLDRTKEKLAGRRLKTWWLMVDIRNESAIEFYRRYGFAVTRRVKRYYGPGRDAWRMRLAL